MIRVPLLIQALLWPLTAGSIDFQLSQRLYLPAGYQPGTVEGEPDLYGFGFGGLESSFYDPLERIFYGGSELGFVTITDFSNWPNTTLAPFGLPLESDLTDIAVCGDLLMITTKDDPNPGAVNIYMKAKRTGDGSITPPSFIQAVQVGVGPDYITANADCSIVATANEGEGVYDDDFGLINPEGSVSILRGPFDNADSPPTVTSVSLNVWTDEELIEQGVHLPLSLNAMIYFNSLNTTDFSVDFSNAITNYTSAAVLEPEYLAWSDDETKLFVSLQENNALVIVDVASGMAESIHSYGLKDWADVPTDIIEDGTCVLQPVEGLKSLRSPDAIASFVHDGVQYIITANEGDDLEYGDFAERVRGSDIFVGTSIPAYPGMTADSAILSQTSNTAGFSRFFNSQCEETNSATPFCQTDMRFSLGSSMVDYSNPESPNIYQLVGIGGRGLSLYQLNESGLELVWDSRDDFERIGCANFPWAHNSKQDEEFAPVGGALYNSLAVDDSLREVLGEMNDPDADGCLDGGDGSPGACPLKEYVDDSSAKDGPAPETVVVGSACGERFMVTSNEKNGIGYVYHLVAGTNPELLQTFHLTPVSESLNVGLAYDQRTLGEVDAESVQFLSADESPSGKAGVMFAGAWSGTLSFWEFNCDVADELQREADSAALKVTPIFVSILAAVTVIPLI